MAEALWRLRGGGGVRFLTAVADDEDGRLIADIAPGLLLKGSMMESGRTASYAAVLDAHGECLIGLGDMAQHQHISVDLVNQHIGVLERAPLVVLDGNAPQATIDYVLATCNRLKKPVFFEPTDKRKAVKGVLNKHCVTFASPNVNELHTMAVHINPDYHGQNINTMEKIIEMSAVVANSINFLVVTLGPKGILIVNNSKINARIRLYPVTPVDNIVNVSGAGDCFASGFIHGLLQGCNEATSVAIGFVAAKAALISHKTVPECLTHKESVKEAKFTEI